MKAAIVCPYDWSYPGGVRTHIIGLGRALAELGVEHEVIAPATNQEPEIYAVGGSFAMPANGSVARICFSRSAAGRVRDRIGNGDFDVLHLHEPLIPSVSMLALMNAGRIPAVATFHASRESSLAYALFRPYLKRYAERLNARIAVSRSAKHLASRYFPGEFRLIPNGVEVGRYAGASPDPDAAAKKPFVLFVGRPEPRKGFNLLLEAMRPVNRRLGTRLVTSFSPTQELPSWVSAMGPVGDEQLPGLYAAADVYCAPSTGGESFGIVLLEAMAAGTPVVASDLPGYREAAGSAARFFPAGDAAELTKALTEVLENPMKAKELSGLGRARAEELDWRNLAEKVAGVYKLAASKRKMGRS